MINHIMCNITLVLWLVMYSIIFFLASNEEPKFPYLISKRGGMYIILSLKRAAETSTDPLMPKDVLPKSIALQASMALT